MPMGQPGLPTVSNSQGLIGDCGYPMGWIEPSMEGVICTRTKTGAKGMAQEISWDLTLYFSFSSGACCPCKMLGCCLKPYAPGWGMHTWCSLTQCEILEETGLLRYSMINGSKWIQLTMKECVGDQGHSCCRTRFWTTQDSFHSSVSLNAMVQIFCNDFQECLVAFWVNLEWFWNELEFFFHLN